MSIYIEYVHARPEFEEVLFKLSQANHFTSADLESNRHGSVGIDQMRHHLRDALMGPALVLLAGIAVSFLVRVSYAGYVEKESIFVFIGKLFEHLLQLHLGKVKEIYFTSAGERLPTIVAIFVVTAPAVAWKKLRQIPFRMIFELFAGRVQREEGTANATSEEVKAPGSAGKKGETIMVHYYTVNDKKVEVSTDGYNALVMGLRYRMYYLKKSKTLLSIEPLLT